jgi:hypothetical protein
MKKNEPKRIRLSAETLRLLDESRLLIAKGQNHMISIDLCTVAADGCA